MNISRSLAAALTFAIVASPIGAQTRCEPKSHAKVPPIEGLVYHNARPKLLRAGWRPVQTITSRSAATNVNTSYGNGRVFWKKGYREVELCSGTGHAACTFLFVDMYGNRLRVMTEGEESRKPSSFASVSAVLFVCPPGSVPSLSRSDTPDNSPL